MIAGTVGKFQSIGAIICASGPTLIIWKFIVELIGVRGFRLISVHFIACIRVHAHQRHCFEMPDKTDLIALHTFQSNLETLLFLVKS